MCAVFSPTKDPIHKVHNTDRRKVNRMFSTAVAASAHVFISFSNNQTVTCNCFAFKINLRKMNPNNFEEQANRILSNENLLANRITRDFIDRNLLDESQHFLSLDQQNVAVKQPKVETTEQIDARAKKFDELYGRLKKFTKTMRKSFPPVDRHCDIHQSADQIDVPELLSKLNQNEVQLPDLDSVFKADEALFQQHRSNIEKVNKLMEAVKGYDCTVTTLPAVGEIEKSMTLLQETISDVDYLNESETMYSGLAKQSPSYLYDEEIKSLSNQLYMQ